MLLCRRAPAPQASLETKMKMLIVTILNTSLPLKVSHSLPLTLERAPRELGMCSFAPTSHSRTEPRMEALPTDVPSTQTNVETSLITDAFVAKLFFFCLIWQCFSCECKMVAHCTLRKKKSFECADILSLFHEARLFWQEWQKPPKETAVRLQFFD